MSEHNNPLREAFIAGFMASGEGFNGEFVRNGTAKEQAERKFTEWTSDYEYVVYNYDEIQHGHEGVQVQCRECGTMNFITQLCEYGCHECDVPPRPITITPSDG